MSWYHRDKCPAFVTLQVEWTKILLWLHLFLFALLKASSPYRRRYVPEAVPLLVTLARMTASDFRFTAKCLPLTRDSGRSEETSAFLVVTKLPNTDTALHASQGMYGRVACGRRLEEIWPLHHKEDKTPSFYVTCSIVLAGQLLPVIGVTLTVEGVFCGVGGVAWRLQCQSHDNDIELHEGENPPFLLKVVCKKNVILKWRKDVKWFEI